VLVSIVTPSYQQAPFLERTLESVARQGVGVEHIVMDGGSTDGTVEILERWRDRIFFSSAPDGGQTVAINAGIGRSRGEVLGYLNSDDVYYEGAVAAAVEAFERDPAADVVYGDAVHIDAGDHIIGAYPTEEWSIERLKLVCFLCQPAVFFRRRVIERFGPFDARLNYCMDYEYWLRLATRGARFVHIPMRLAASRVHDATKTRTRPREAHAETNDMLRERIGYVPDNWLWNYAHAVLDARGIARSTNRGYLLRAAALTAMAAFRWNTFPSLSLIRGTGSWFVHGSSFVTRRAESDV
jgi:glycosyltransferase involved in cell wall biosynthesis